MTLDHRADGTGEGLAEPVTALQRGHVARGNVLGLGHAARVVARARDAGASLTAIEFLTRAGRRRDRRARGHQDECSDGESQKSFHTPPPLAYVK